MKTNKDIYWLLSINGPVTTKAYKATYASP